MLLPEMPAFAQPIALKARQIVPLGEKCPVTGAALLANPLILDNAFLALAEGRIVSLGRRPPPGFPERDLGDVAILPPLVNAHTHLQLSWLAGQTTWHEGFTPWLRSLLPLLLPVTKGNFAAGSGAAVRLAALDKACASMAGACVGDVGGSITGAVTAVQAAAMRHGLLLSHFCEWFGFASAPAPWPPRAAGDINTALEPHCAPAGHGLYSTRGAILRRARQFCREQGRVFSFHLAESPEESELLLHGTGPLADLYRSVVLPDNWQPPGLSPCDLALRLDLLGPGTLAVHGTQLNAREIRQFAASGAALCLCPRSNANLAVGAAPVWTLLEAGTHLCLGTDGLTSSPDLDVRQEAFFLAANSAMPMQALWRLATINGAAALGHGHTGLRSGGPAAFSLWPCL